MIEVTIEELKEEIRRGARCALQVRHAERPKMDPDDPTFGDMLKLTAEGVRTATLLGEWLKEFKDDTTFVASPLTRTRMTAECIAEGMGAKRILEAKDPAWLVTDEKLGNGSFYYDDPLVVLEVFKNDEFFHVCFEYERTGEYRGFRNLYTASDELEAWLLARLEKKLLIAATHDCYISDFLSARGVCPEGFSRENWTRFLDGGAIFVYPDGSRRYALVRTGLSTGICGVKTQSV